MLDSTGKNTSKIDPRYFRPAEVDLLIGDAAKARKVLGWTPKITFKALAKMMADADLKLARQERMLADQAKSL